MRGGLSLCCHCLQLPPTKKETTQFNFAMGHGMKSYNCSERIGRNSLGQGWKQI